MNKIILKILITTIVAGGAGFYGGMIYGQSAKSQANLANNFQSRRSSGSQQGGGFTGGEIIAKDGTSITVKLMNGGSKIVFLSDAAKITKSVQGLVTDLATGEQVSVTGSANQDGSITAQLIQIRPAFRTNQ